MPPVVPSLLQQLTPALAYHEQTAEMTSLHPLSIKRFSLPWGFRSRRRRWRRFSRCLRSPPLTTRWPRGRPKASPRIQQRHCYHSLCQHQHHRRRQLLLLPLSRRLEVCPAPRLCSATLTWRITSGSNTRSAMARWCRRSSCGTKRCCACYPRGWRCKLVKSRLLSDLILPEGIISRSTPQAVLCSISSVPTQFAVQRGLGDCGLVGDAAACDPDLVAGLGFCFLPGIGVCILLPRLLGKSFSLMHACVRASEQSISCLAGGALKMHSVEQRAVTRTVCGDIFDVCSDQTCTDIALAVGRPDLKTAMQCPMCPAPKLAIGTGGRGGQTPPGRP